MWKNPNFCWLSFGNSTKNLCLVGTGNRSVGNLWKLHSTHLAFAPREVALFVGLHGKHPSSRRVVSRLELPHINEVNNLVAKQGFPQHPCTSWADASLKVVKMYLYGCSQFSVVTIQNDPAAATPGQRTVLPKS